MGTTENNNAYTDRITSIVGGFVEVWNKFEAMLFDELASTHKVNEGDYDNYGLLYRISGNIYPDNDLTMGELSNALSVPLSTATRMVNSMVADGYLKRLSDPEDRRIVRVALTDRGIETYNTIRNYTVERLQNLLSNLTVDEQVKLLQLIDKVIFALKQASK